MELRARDTSPEAEAVQRAVLARMAPEQRFKICLALSDAAREYSRGGIRSRHPEYDEHQVEMALRHMIHGTELFSKAWPHEPLLEP